MNDQQIFEYLFSVASSSTDSKGIVAACLVSNGEVFASAASSDDGLKHAEDVLFQRIQSEGKQLPSDATLYVTLAPCSKRTKPGMSDCVAQILDKKVSAVIYGASDPDQISLTMERLSQGGVRIGQVSDKEVLKRCAEIFNSSVSSEERAGGVTLKPTQ